MPPIRDPVVRERINAWIVAGTPATEIERRLREFGLTPEEAVRLIDDTLAGLIDAESNIRRSAERRDILRGGAWCLGGVAFLAAGLATFHWLGRLPVGPVGLFVVSAAALGRGGFLILRALT